MTSSISTPTLARVAPPISIFASSDSSPLFSIQDALSTFSGFNNANVTLGIPNGGSGTLFRSGCVVDGILNCTAACQDVNQIFANPHTFQNCMVVASLTVLGSIVTLDASSTLLAEEFSIHLDQPGFESLAIGANQIIHDCLTQYLGNSSGFHVPWTPWYFGLEGFEFTHVSSFPSVCDNFTSVPLNADVGGIGVHKSRLF